MSEPKPQTVYEEIEELIAERDRALTQRDAWHNSNTAAESRIESLVGEREELREALGKVYTDALTLHVKMPWTNEQLVGEPFEALQRIREVTRSVLSSGETTDPREGPIVLDAAASRRLDDIIASPSGELPDPPSRETAPRDVETTDSPPPGNARFSKRNRQNSGIPGDEYRCPTCGSDDPGTYLTCTDTFHSTDRGKEDSP